MRFRILGPLEVWSDGAPVTASFIIGWVIIGPALLDLGVPAAAVAIGDDRTDEPEQHFVPVPGQGAERRRDGNFPGQRP